MIRLSERRGWATAVRFSALTLMVLVFVPAAVAETNINFLLGAKFLEEDDWPLGDSQGMFAIQTTFGPKKWPVSIAIDAVGSGHVEEGLKLGDNIQLTQDLVQNTSELDLGVRKIWQVGKARPFVGGGLAIVSGRQEAYLDTLPPSEIPDPPLPPDGLSTAAAVIHESDTGVGLWIDGGIFWRLTKRFNLGLEARYSRAELDLLVRGAQAGGTHVGLLLGFGW